MAKKWLRTFSGALCVALLLGSVPAVAKTTNITQNEAKETAWVEIPNTCSFLTTDLEKYWYEVKFFDVTTQEKHIIEVGKTSGDILEHSMVSAVPAGTRVKISASDAEKTIQELHKDAIGVIAKLQEDESGSYYTVQYRSTNTRNVAQVNAETGKVMSWRKTYLQEKDKELLGTVKKTSGTTSAVVWNGSIQDMVTQLIPGGAITKLAIVGDATLYDVKVHKGDYEYDLLFDAATGKRVSLSSNYDPADFRSDWYQKPGSVKKPSGQGGMDQISSQSSSQMSTTQYIGKKLAGVDVSSNQLNRSATLGTSSATNSTSNNISRDRAKQIAQHMAPTGALLKSMSLKSGNGKTYYQGWLKKDGMRYGFQIDATSGEVIGSSVEVDPNWDPTEHHDIDSLKDEDKDYEMKWLD